MLKPLILLPDFQSAFIMKNVAKHQLHLMGPLHS